MPPAEAQLLLKSDTALSVTDRKMAFQVGRDTLSLLFGHA